MRYHTFDLRLFIGLVIAHLLLFFSFQDRSVFWYILTASMLVLIIYEMFQKKTDNDKVSFFTYLLLGLGTGISLYIVFWLVYHGLSLIHLSIEHSVGKLYHYYAPNVLGKYLALIIVVIPGEEFFWRRFILKRLLSYFTPKVSIILGAALYASVFIYSHSLILIIAFLFCGLVWGSLYLLKKNLPLVIVSHMVFSILLYGIF